MYHIYQIDTEMQPGTNQEAVPLATKIDGVTNTTAKKGNTLTSPSRGAGWLPGMLTGGAVIAGTGLLAAGGYCLFLAGRNSVSNCPGQANQPQSADMPVILPTSVNEYRLGSTILPDTPVSPYSYYENIYGDSATRNKILQTAPTPTTKSSSGDINIPTSETLFTTYKHEGKRDTYYNTVLKDIYYPLGRKLHGELSEFYSSEIEGNVVHAYKADPVLRCTLLREIADKIDIYESEENLLRDAYNVKETLNAGEHAREILVNRKLTALYLAAECIINKQDIDVFYHQTMAENQKKEHYTTEELTRRHNAIMDYFPVHDAMGECVS